ncbi:MAG TPA: hypothetical protein VGT08_11080 [Terracidiphilus sp.]|nr:hypothetical protein [Terracidiphilus sp.]
MIEQCLPMPSRRYYIRLRAQKWEAAMARHKEQLTSLRCEIAARNALPSGQHVLAEWKLSEEFIGEMAVALVDAALETCELYAVPLDLTLSTCIEKEVESYIEVQFRYALQNHGRGPVDSQLPANMKDALAGRIRTASFNILNPVQIRLEKARVTAERQGAKRENECKENNRPMGLEMSSAEEAVLAVLRESYPTKIHIQPLVDRVAPSLEFSVVLQAVEGLHRRGLVDCVPLKDSSGLRDAANIVLSAEGARSLQTRSDNEAPAQVTVLNVLISSPSDVLAERDAVEEAIQEWNGNHHKSTGIMLHPVRWETHAYPALGDRPQGILNKQIVQSAHFLIGIFGTRLGTPTGVAPSGTIEEIEEIRKSGKHVALYFSNAPTPRNVDRAQLDALEAYQRSLQGQGVYFQYGSVEELRRLVTNHLPKIVNEVQANLRNGNLPAVVPKSDPITWRPAHQVPHVRLPRIARHALDAELNSKEMELLWEAAQSSDGEIYHSTTLDGEGLRANNRHFLSGANARSASEWLSALRGLEERSLIEPLNADHDLFRVTGEGYAAADQLEGFARWNAYSVMLRAYYMNADTQEHKVDCKGVIALPATYYPDQVSPDGFVQRSEKESRSLLVEGVGTFPNINWNPTDVEFTDEATGKVETFRVRGMQVIRPDKLKLPLS